MTTPILQKISLAYNDQLVHLNLNKKTFLDELYVDLQRQPLEGGERFQITLHPKELIHLKELSLSFAFDYLEKDKILCNGWQSWSWTREYAPSEEIKPQRKFAKSYLQYSGDDSFGEVQRGKGILHSWTYTYIRRGQDFILLGSLNEQTAFTLLHHFTAQNTLKAEAQIGGYQMKHSFPVLDFCLLRGSEQAVFDAYFELQQKKRPIAPSLLGWTSWYRHYTHISEAIILQNLQAACDTDSRVELIQIDDGYQKAVGDWLQIKPAFPKGMAALAKAIHHKGLKAGLWLAPFVCASNSDLFKQRPDWLVKNEKGEAVKMGYNPHWGGWFYALDVRLPAVREHLSGIFYTILQKWGYDFLKLDFLYVACAYPQKDLTRGQLMHQAMQFLREVMGNKPMLACGVPLGSAFGVADYCRIGADVHTRWEHRLLAFLRHRERVSTQVATDTVLFRRQLDGRAFRNDPDVLIFRPDHQHLSASQQNTLALINSLCSQTLFLSDDVSQYQAEQLSEWHQAIEYREADVRALWQENEVDVLSFRHQGLKWTAYVNRHAKKKTAIHQGHSFVLYPFESIVLQNQ